MYKQNNNKKQAKFKRKIMFMTRHLSNNNDYNKGSFLSEKPAVNHCLSWLVINILNSQYVTGVNM